MKAACRGREVIRKGTKRLQEMMKRKGSVSTPLVRSGQTRCTGGNRKNRTGAVARRGNDQTEDETEGVRMRKSRTKKVPGGRSNKPDAGQKKYVKRQGTAHGT